jgi:phage I-like protein
MADSAKQYLVIDKDGKGHLPVRDSPDGPLNHRLMGAAWAALHGGYRGNKYEGPGKEEAIRRLKALYKSEGMETPSEQDSDAGADLQGLRHPKGIENRPPRFVWSLSDLGTSTTRIGLAVTGKWLKNGEEFEITEDDLVLAGENFRKKLTGEINVDYDHASEMPEVALGGPVPSAGRIVGLVGPEPYVDPRGTERQILWGDYEPTPRARELIQNREYRYISPAINWGARDKLTGKRQGTTLTSVALTNRPFLEELPQIRLSDPAFQEVRERKIENRKAPSTFARGPEQSRMGKSDSDFPFSIFDFRDGGTMKTLALKHVDGAHQVFDGSEPVGVLPHDHLKAYASKYVFEGGGKNGDGDDDDKTKASCHAEEVRPAIFAEIGVADVETARRAVSTAKESERAGKAAAELSKLYLAEKPDEDAADRLLSDGTCTLTELRRAERARKAIDAAMQAGKILPVDRSVAFGVAFSDPKAFGDWIAKRPVSPRLGPPVGIGGTGIEGATARQQMAELVAAKRDQLRKEKPNADFKVLIDEATALVRKENPELFRRYREEKA